MKVSELIQKMIEFTAQDSSMVEHDINHLMKVWGFAKTIGELENLDEETQYILEIAAVLHDIACPCCRRKYGSATGKDQEREGPAIAESFLESTDLTSVQISRVKFLIAHHHTYTDIDGLDYQILLEADFIVNASESRYSKECILTFRDNVFKTQSGKTILNNIYVN